ncbi:MAG: Transcriptional regulator, AraC family [Pseudonocardiales bacterium]|nr:Transcriptional regulator, AraC family [Pseudonocardiales bacterium]
MEFVNETARARPASPLAPFVDAYLGYRQRGVPPALHRGLPSPYLTVIFTLDEPLEIAQHVDPRQTPGTFDALVGGLHTTPALIKHDGAQSGIQLRLSPLGARALLGVPAGELASLDVHGSDLLGPLAGMVHERLRGAVSWPDRFAVLDEMLAPHLQSTAPVPDEVTYAWQRLTRSGGNVPVAQLAGETGWSSRHLANQMRAECGLTPKAAARVIRFHRARAMLQAGRSGAGVAAACGYYDQPHLVNEFRALAGCTPSRWLADEFANLQASRDLVQAG